MNAVESTYVRPFYLKMMGLNAVRLTEELWASVIAAGRTITAGEVSTLLGTGMWRPVVMGAWFSLTVPAEQILDDLVLAMSRSQGSLTAPPLAAAATLVAGTRAVPAMITFIEAMVASTRPDGSQDIVAAAVEHLGMQPPVAPSDRGRHAFHDILGVARRLRDAL
jgi:hypothetical protein